MSKKTDKSRKKEKEHKPKTTFVDYKTPSEIAKQHGLKGDVPFTDDKQFERVPNYNWVYMKNLLAGAQNIGHGFPGSKLDGTIDIDQADFPVIVKRYISTNECDNDKWTARVFKTLDAYKLAYGNFKACAPNSQSCKTGRGCKDRLMWMEYLTGSKKLVDVVIVDGQMVAAFGFRVETARDRIEGRIGVSATYDKHWTPPSAFIDWVAQALQGFSGVVSCTFFGKNIVDIKLRPTVSLYLDYHPTVNHKLLKTYSDFYYEIRKGRSLEVDKITAMFDAVVPSTLTLSLTYILLSPSTRVDQIFWDDIAGFANGINVYSVHFDIPRLEGTRVNHGAIISDTEDTGRTMLDKLIEYFKDDSAESGSQSESESGSESKSESYSDEDGGSAEGSGDESGEYIDDSQEDDDDASGSEITGEESEKSESESESEEPPPPPKKKSTTNNTNKKPTRKKK